MKRKGIQKEKDWESVCGRKRNSIFHMVGKDPWFLAAAAATFAEGAVRIALAETAGGMVNLAAAGETERMWQTAFLAAAGILLIQFCVWGKEKLYAVSLEGQVLKIKRQCFQKLARASVGSLNAHHREELGAACLNDINALSNALRPFVVMCFSLVLMRLETVAYMLGRNWFVTAAMLCVSPVLLLVQNRLARPVKNYQKENLNAMGKMLGAAADAFSQAEFIKAGGLEKEMGEQFGKEQERQKKAALSAKKMEAVQGALSYLSEILPRMLLIAAAGLEVAKGWMSPGEILVFVSLSASGARLLKGMAEMSVHLQNVRACLERVELSDMEPEQTGEGKEEEKEESQGIAVRLSHVTFGYQKEKPVLKDFSMEVRQGEWVRLAGESGSGKSTVFQLLCGFYRPEEGRITVDGMEAAGNQLSSVRKRLAYVPQFPCLLPVSVYENISCGRKEVTRERAEELLEQVGLGPWLKSLKRGLDTLLDGHETGVSGGQRQRIAIARGLAKGSRILLLDEVTAGLDRKTEEKVYKTLQKELTGLTVLLITHNEQTMPEIRTVWTGGRHERV